MNITWATDYFGDGNAYGYSIHNRRAREAAREAGLTLTDDADVAIHVCPAHRFEPIAGKQNILYTAWEAEDLPPRYVEQMKRADALVVTAAFLLPIVRRQVPGVPVFLCHLGVDAETFPFTRRQHRHGQTLRFLWLGAPNARKGWELILQAWRVFAGDRRFELYIKTTVTGKRERIDNIVFDSRNYTQQELTDLYHSAHAFLFPSFGEGFGLTMAEAMATGLPVIYTPWSAMNDLADASCGYPLRYRMIPARVTNSGGLLTSASSKTAEMAKGAVHTRLAHADAVNLVERMAEVVRDYPRAAAKGERAARRIRKRFTWTRTGQRLARIAHVVAANLSPASCR